MSDKPKKNKKEAELAKILPRLIDDFEHFRNECQDLRIAFNTFQSLFQSGNKTEMLLRETANLFFEDLNAWLIQIVNIKIGKLTERSGSSGGKNITTNYFVEELSKLYGQDTPLSAINGKLNAYRKIVASPRNKIFAHNDRTTFRRNAELGAHSESEMHNFYENLQEFTDIVGIKLGLGPLDYRTQAGEGDAQDLLAVLKKYRHIKETVC